MNFDSNSSWFKIKIFFVKRLITKKPVRGKTSPTVPVSEIRLNRSKNVFCGRDLSQKKKRRHFFQQPWRKIGLKLISGGMNLVDAEDFLAISG